MKLHFKILPIFVLLFTLTCFSKKLLAAEAYNLKTSFRYPISVCFVPLKGLKQSEEEFSFQDGALSAIILNNEENVNISLFEYNNTEELYNAGFYFSDKVKIEYMPVEKFWKNTNFDYLVYGYFSESHTSNFMVSLIGYDLNYMSVVYGKKYTFEKSEAKLLPKKIIDMLILSLKKYHQSIIITPIQ